MKKTKKNMPPKKKLNLTKVFVWVMLLLMVASTILPLVIYAVA